MDRRALKEDGLRRVKGLAAVEDDEAQASAVRIDDGHEQVGRDGHQPVRGEPVVAGEDEHGAIVHLRIAREHHVSSGLLLQTPNAYHGASFAEEEPRLAVGKGFLELGNIRVVEAYGWKYGLRNAQDKGHKMTFAGVTWCLGMVLRTEICSASAGTVERKGTSPV